jgi:choline kinase
VADNLGALAAGSEAPGTLVGVILVAGVGSRLRPLTNDRPKALMMAGGETLLGRAVRLLLAAGVTEVVLATGYREEAVREAMRSCPARVTYCRNDAFDSTQNSVSLLLCREAIAGRPFFKLDGDLLFHPGVLARLARAPEGIAAAVDRRATLGAEEMKVAVEGSEIRAFGKHLDPATAHGESIGLERVSGVAVSSLFHGLESAVRSGDTTLYYEDVYSRVLGPEARAWAVDVSDLPWTEVDTPEDLARAQALVAEGGLDRDVAEVSGGAGAGASSA